MTTRPTEYQRDEQPDDWTPPSSASTAVSDLSAYTEDTIQPILKELEQEVDRLIEQETQAQREEGGTDGDA